VVRNIENPNDCFIYRGHAHKTTVAKFSPSGFWVCSADISGKVKVWAWDNPEHLTKLETSVSWRDDDAFQDHVMTNMHLGFRWSSS
jgi:WD repeat-containing protein 1 (actin-interacting protein 1)